MRSHTELALETKLMLDQVVAEMHCKSPVYRSPAKAKIYNRPVPVESIYSI
jgi:hypothetical protein